MIAEVEVLRTFSISHSIKQSGSADLRPHPQLSIKFESKPGYRVECVNFSGGDSMVVQVDDLHSSNEPTGVSRTRMRFTGCKKLY